MKHLITAILGACVVASCARSGLQTQPQGFRGTGSRALYSEKSKRNILDVTDQVILTPMHLAIPNPNLTSATAESRMRSFFRHSTITTSLVESKTIQWATDTLGYVSPTFTSNSQIWAVTFTGNLTWPLNVTTNGTLAIGTKAICVLDVESGHLIACRITK